MSSITTGPGILNGNRRCYMAALAFSWRLEAENWDRGALECPRLELAARIALSSYVQFTRSCFLAAVDLRTASSCRYCSLARTDVFPVAAPSACPLSPAADVAGCVRWAARCRSRHPRV